MIRRRALAPLFALLVAAVAACGASPEAPGSARCPAATLPDGAVVSAAGGGGISGEVASYVAFADGKVDLSEGLGTQAKTRTVDVGKARIDKLVGDIRATEVTDEEEGCYVGEPEADGTSGGFVLRDGASVRRWSHDSGGDAPDAVEEASSVALAFLQGVRQQK